MAKNSVLAYQYTVRGFVEIPDGDDDKTALMRVNSFVDDIRAKVHKDPHATCTEVEALIAEDWMADDFRALIIDSRNKTVYTTATVRKEPPA